MGSCRTAAALIREGGGGGGSGSSGTKAMLTKAIYSFPQPLQANSQINLKSGHDRFLLQSPSYYSLTYYDGVYS
jgi:hypothetical protein